MKALPDFADIPMEYAERYISDVLTKGDETALTGLTRYEDGHFRAIFEKAYFRLEDQGREDASKSQWNTLKKRMKRLNAGVFVFKDHGEIDAEHYYLDFGFFAD
jgi:hypothetical protein